MERAIHNPVTGERMTYVETSRDSRGARTVGEVAITPGGGVFLHRHADHDERIEVLDGDVEVTLARVRRRLHAGEQILIPRGTVHAWRNPSPDRPATFRGTMTPGHPGFETALRIAFGLGRDGGLRSTGVPRRFTDLALIAMWDPSLLDVGPRRWLAPLMRWAASRPAARARAAELLRRYPEPEVKD